MDLEKHIVKREMKMFQVELRCPECEKGMMMTNSQAPTGSTETGEPIYLHECNNPECGHQLQITKPYPHITNEPVEPLESNEPKLTIEK